MTAKSRNFFPILFCKPKPVATDTTIIKILIAIAAMAIFIIGDDVVLLYPLDFISLLAMKYSKFNFWLYI